MRLTRNHDIIARAHADGSQDLPATYDLDPNATQREIVEAAENEIAKLRQHVEQEMRICARELEKQDFSPSDVDVDAPVEAAVHEFAKLQTRSRERIPELEQQTHERYQELRYFRADNRLFRSALYPNSRILSVAFLLLLITAEAILNAKLFAQADPLGLLGGWLQAIIVSVLNVLPSFVVGIIVIRNLHHVQLWRQSLATVSFLIYLATVVAYNLLIAHYRVALAIDPDNAVALALPHLQANPLGIDESLEAVFLFGLGLFAAACALIDGYCIFDDRYPGYGSIDRRHRNAIAQRERAKATFRRNIERVVARATRAIDRGLYKLHKKVVVANRQIGKAISCLSRSERKAAQVARTCERYLRTYREENRRVRTTRPPSYYDIYPGLNADFDQDPSPLLAKREGLKAAVDAKMRDASVAKARLRGLAEKEIANLGMFAAQEAATRERAHADLSRGRLVGSKS